MPILSIFLSINLLFLVSGYHYPNLLQENNLLENIQALTLTLSMATFLYACFKDRLRSIAFLCAAICLAFILREIDIENLHVPNLAVVLFSGIGKYILMLLLLCPSTLWVLKNYKITFLTERVIIPFSQFAVLSIIFFALSWIFDKGVFDTNQNILFEELSELNAYLLIFITALLYNKKFATQRVHSDN